MVGEPFLCSPIVVAHNLAVADCDNKYVFTKVLSGASANVDTLHAFADKWAPWTTQTVPTVSAVLGDTRPTIRQTVFKIGELSPDYLNDDDRGRLANVNGAVGEEEQESVFVLPAPSLSSDAGAAPTVLSISS